MQTIPFKTLQIDAPSPGIIQVSFNRPQVRNAINSEMMHELWLFWEQIYIDTGKTRCIILTGKDTAFCAGADLKERNTMTSEQWNNQRRIFEHATKAMMDCPLPIIAAVNGPAFGGGLELVLSSDFAYGATTASFSQSEVKLGLIPGIMGTQNLPRACGIKRAKELTFTGDTFTAEDAYAWGILNKLCAPEQLMDEVLMTARRIADNAPLAVRQAKKALTQSQNLDLKNGYAFELEAYNSLLNTKDREEGIRAFNERRKPSFVGE